MSLDFIDELEKKVDNLINSLKKTRNENKEKNSRIHELEKENGNLKNDLAKIKNDSSDSRIQFDSVAEKIKKLLTRLETVE